MTNLTKLSLGLAVALAGGCVLEVADEPELAETDEELIAANKLAANKLAANKLAANKLAANKLAASSLETKQLMDTSDGREVMGYVVGCALPTGQSVTLTTTAGASYTFPGWIGLAPAWATRAPTVSERRWVSACLLSRTNLFGIQVNISMRHDTNLALYSSTAERNTYTNAEGGFYGDLFGPSPLMYACANRAWTQYQSNWYRACALSSNSLTTDCGFTYTGLCNSPTCSDRTAPFGGCIGSAVNYPEVITIFLTPTQQQGQTQ